MSCRRPDNTHAGVIIHDDGSFEANIEEQTEALLQNMKIIVERCGGSMDQLVDLTTFSSQHEGLRWLQQRLQPLVRRNRPARTTVAVAELPHPHLLIEMKVIVALDGSTD